MSKPIEQVDFTPGPWHTGPVTAAGSVWVYKDCFPLAEPANFWNRIKYAGRILLCRVRGDVAWKHYQESKETHEARYWATIEANARLMAAAPDLLAALQTMVKWEQGRPGGFPCPHLGQAKAAIGQALGESQK